MNNQLTEIAFILDRSGSMSGMEEAAINAFNHFLREQQDTQGLARLSLVLFDDEYLMPVRSLPVAEITPLDETTYIPRNSTALLDAVGKTIDDLGHALNGLPEQDRPGKVIIVIFTDGLENASTKYTWRDVQKKIRHQTEKYSWEFLFLAANQDAIATAAQLSISAGNAANYVHDTVGYKSSASAVSRKISAIRRSMMKGVFTQDDLKAISASMSDMLAEEEGKNRDETEN